VTHVATDVMTDVGLLVQGQADGGASLTALEKLTAAANALMFLDGDFGYALSGGSVSALLDRTLVHTVSQGPGPTQPTWGVQSPTGRRGITFAASNAQRLEGAPAVAAALAGLQPYSTLEIVRFASFSAIRAVWGVGTVANTANSLYEGANISTGADFCFRSGSGGSTQTIGAGATHNTSLACNVTQFDGGAYNSWINGATAITGLANTRSPGAMDLFSLGARRLSGGYANYMDGDFYCLIVSLSQWSTGQRQDIEGYSKEWWGWV
jgi:hypothetical protein